MRFELGLGVIGLRMLAIAFALAPQVVHAAEVVGTRGDWEIFRDSRSCGMTRSYPGSGQTEMMVIKYVDETVRIMITNTGWSAKQDRLYDISYELNGATYGGAKAIGTAEGERRGFVSTFVSDFAGDLAKGSTLRIFLSDKEIERLPLTGTGVALALVDQCLTDVRAALSAAKRETTKRSKLPKDPFKTKDPFKD